VKFSSAVRVVLRNVFIVSAACIVFNSVTANAAPGDFDSSFGSGLGKVLHSLGGRDDYPLGMMTLPDRKLLIHGWCQKGTLPSAPYEYCLARFNENGSLDSSFGTNGRVIANFSAISRTPVISGIPRNIVRLADGRIIFALSCVQTTGSTETRMCLAGFTDNGALDTRFGTNGYATFDVGGANVQVVDMALQNDGKVLVGARCVPTSNGTLSYFCIARFLSNGNADGETFGDGGFKITQILSSAEPSGLAIDVEGRAVLGGRCRSNSPANSPYLFCAARYTTAGQLDTTFGTAGKMTNTVGGGVDADTGPVIAQPDSNIAIMGRCKLNTSSPNEFCMLRLLPNGSVDNTIGAAGLLWTSGAARGAEITSARLTPDGKYLFAGPCYVSSTNSLLTDFCVMRIKLDGVRDTSFGTNGQVIHPIGSTRDDLSAVAMTSDGKIVVAGGCEGTNIYVACLARLEGGPGSYRACSLDLDGDGRFTATSDGLIQQRILNDVRGNAAINGVNFPASATRTTWSSIRQFLVAQCGMDLPQ
jgi:uncharacterized delta-60 repeat protein